PHRRGAGQVAGEAAGRRAGDLADHEGQVLAVRLDAGVDPGEGEAEGRSQGRNHRRSSRPSVASQPKRRVRFCTAGPAAPLTRLSMAAQARKRGPSTAKPMLQTLVPTTRRSETAAGESTSSTKGSSA